jgi:hypothetical protein
MNNVESENDDSKQIESYNKMGNNYAFWEWSAKGLLESAKILRREREREWRLHKGRSGGYVCPPEYFTEEVEWMLQAFAIECLLKGLFVKGGHEIVKNGKYKGVPNAGDHDLVNLAKEIMGTMSKEHNNVLRKLGLIGKTVGRYPIPKKRSKLRFCDEENALGIDDPSVQIADNEQSLIDTFINELLRKLTEKGG